MEMQHFDVITDHNPLISILNNLRLDEIDNPRLQHLRTKIMAFNFTAVWHKDAINQAQMHYFIIQLAHRSPQSCWLRMMRRTTRNPQLQGLKQSTRMV